MSNPDPSYVPPTMITEPEFDIKFYEEDIIDILNKNYDINTIKRIASYYIPVIKNDGRQFYIFGEDDMNYLYGIHQNLESKDDVLVFIQRHYINKEQDIDIGLPIVDVCIIKRKITGGKKYNRKTRKNKQRSLKTKIN